MPDLASGRVPAIPESAVIDTGRETIVYRETLPGTFEGVLVTLGPKMTGPENAIYFPLLKGLELGEQIVTSGSFLVDAETRLSPAAGSIYFGGSSGGSKTGGSVTTVRPTTPDNEDAKLKAALAKLAPGDRALAEQQKFCPILADSRLGSMGVPVKLMLKGQPVFVCCPSCEKPASDDPEVTLQKLAARKAGDAAKPQAAPAPRGSAGEEAEAKIRGALAKLSAEDRALAEQQRFCPVLPNSRLGSMGPPIKLMIEGQPVFLCCAGCKSTALAKPKETLQKVKTLREQKQPTETSAREIALKETDPEIRAELLKLSDGDLQLVLAQKICVVAENSRLGSMGPPLKVMIDGKPVFLCCDGCRETALEKPQETLKAAERLRRPEKDAP